MPPLWRRIRLIVTLVSGLIGVGLLYLAFSLAGRFPSATIGSLALLGIVLPVGLYLIATVTGWQRSAASGATPNAVVGWIIRNRVAPVLPIIFMFFLLGLVRELGMTPSDQAAHDQTALAQSFSESCVAGAGKEIARRGGDPDRSEMKAKMVSYCTCALEGLQRSYTPDEFFRLVSVPGAIEKEEKAGQIMEGCAKAASG